MIKAFFALVCCIIFSYNLFAKDLIIKVGATPVPAAEILEFVKPLLKEQGITLVVQGFTDYITPDISLNDGSSDANLYQHKPFLDKINKDRGFQLVAMKPIYIVPLGFYSKKYKTLDSIASGSVIALPNDPTNYSRALILLNDNGVIKLSDPNNLDATEFDIVENKKNLKFKQVEAAMLPKILDGVDGAVINANYALQAGMSLKEAFFYENNKSAYVNILATKKGNENNPSILKLQEVLLSDKVRDFILKKYSGEIIPVSSK